MHQIGLYGTTRQNPYPDKLVTGILNIIYYNKDTTKIYNFKSVDKDIIRFLCPECDFGTNGYMVRVQNESYSQPLHFDAVDQKVHMKHGKKKWLLCKELPYFKTPIEEKSFVHFCERLKFGDLVKYFTKKGIKFRIVTTSPGDTLPIAAGEWHATQGLPGINCIQVNSHPKHATKIAQLDAKFKFIWPKQDYISIHNSALY